MIINDLDLGSAWLLPRSSKNGQAMGNLLVVGSREIYWPTGGQTTQITGQISIVAPFAIGDAAAGSVTAAQRLATQLQQLAGNPDLNPVYVQFASGAGSTVSTADDGFFIIGDLSVARPGPVNTSWLDVTMTLTKVSAGPPGRVGIATDGGALASSYSRAATPWVAYPVGATVLMPTTVTRVGGEGSIPVTVSPAAMPARFVPSTTIANLFLGGCRIYDANGAIGTNPVPTDGTFKHANWVEVKSRDHRFIGDIVITNGLLLFTFALGSSIQPTCYLWNTQLGTAAWQNVGTIGYSDSTSQNDGVIRQLSIVRVFGDEVIVRAIYAATNQVAEFTYRLQRGAYQLRIDARPLTQNNTVNYFIIFRHAATPKIIWNSGAAGDQILDAGLTAQTDDGYSGGTLASSSHLYVTGLLWQNPPNNKQPLIAGAVASYLGIGETTGPAQNATRSYGFHAFPFPTTQNLQGEGESGTLGTGWTSQAGVGGNSNALEAKCASGTLTGNADTFGTAWQPPTGSGYLYDVWFRVKVTSAAGGVAEMKLGLYNSTDSVFLASTTYAANAFTTSYTWKKVAAGVTPTAAKNMRFRAETTATIGTDWFIDEAALVPVSNGQDWPRDQFQQYLSDRTSNLVI